MLDLNANRLDQVSKHRILVFGGINNDNEMQSQVLKIEIKFIENIEEDKAKSV